ncbi:MAG: adenylate kinase [Muribaculaceae bacterium]|nr:adenylate kinase [Muribaculaceae bacterium]
MLNLVLFGAPGSGKGTQSEKIIDRYGLHHISTGEVLRRQIKEGTELGKIAESYISKGHLIPDDLMIDILRQELKGLPKDSKGVIFDGFPRTIPQAEELEKLLAENGTELTGVVGLEVPEEELVARMLKRGKDTGRADDNIDTILNRLKVYHSQTEPLKEHYQGKGSYMHIDGLGDVDSIFSAIAKAIDAR